MYCVFMTGSTLEAPTPVSPFDLDHWLAQREANHGLTVVELGHGSRPLAEVQHFTDGRAYVGIEAGLSSFFYGGVARQVIARLRENRPDENIFFFEQAVDPQTRTADDARTILPNGAASEVFLRNVLSDKAVYTSVVEVAKILGEASRLTEPGGSLVISETITPYDPVEVRRMAEEVGLVFGDLIGPKDSGWDRLQDIYLGETSMLDREHPQGHSYYMILSKPYQITDH